MYKIGDRVAYVGGEHGDYKNNPLWGGIEGKVMGTVTSYKGIESWMGVAWDNGSHNSYKHTDLMHIKMVMKSETHFDEGLFEI